MDPALATSISRRRRRFAARGIAFALMSGACYGLYTALLSLAQTQGVWGAWLSGTPWGDGRTTLGAFAVAFALPALAAGLNDLFSGAWALLVCARERQIGDLWATLRSRPGLVMVLCAVIGGPFATICYVVALNGAAAAGNPGVIVPIAALNCAIGAVLGRVLFHQRLEAHALAGIAACLGAGALIGGASFASMGPDALTACAFALLAAFGWGFEGCVAGFGAALIDHRVGIVIRQVAAGTLELAVVFPALMALSQDTAGAPQLLGTALASPALGIFALSGLFAMPAYALWYKGNSMCGTALGMACNSTYAFWGPFFIWIIMGVLGIGGMSASYPPLSVAQWIGAAVMVAGIFVIAAKPRERAGTAEDGAKARPESDEGERFAHAAEKADTGTRPGDDGAPGGAGCARAEGPSPSRYASSGKKEQHGENPGAMPAHPEPDGRAGARRIPLYYAVMLHFMDGAAHTARDVAAALSGAYAGRRRLGPRAMEEALATARENGLLDEAGHYIDERGELETSCRISGFGRETVERHLTQQAPSANAAAREHSPARRSDPVHVSTRRKAPR